MDGIFGIGFPELVMIVVIALIVLGPERLPGTLREVAKFIKQIRAIGNELMTQFGGEFKELQDLDPRRILNEMTDPNKPDVPSKTPVTKPAQNTVATTSTAKTTTPKPATSTPPSSNSSAAKSLAASAAVVSSDKASNEENKAETNANSTPPVRPTSEETKEAKSVELSSSNGNTIAPPVPQPVSVASSTAPLQNGNGQPAELVESKPQPGAEVVHKEASATPVQADDRPAAESKPKRTRKPRAMDNAENEEQAVEQSEGGTPHEPTN